MCSLRTFHIWNDHLSQWNCNIRFPTFHSPMGKYDGLYMLSPGSHTIRGCGPVGVGMAYFSRCIPVALCFLEVSILLADFRWRCRTLSSSCTKPAWMLPCSRLDDTVLNFWTCKPASMKCGWSFIRLACVMVSVQSSKTLTKTPDLPWKRSYLHFFS